jgi:hypothetical protein
LLGKVAGDEAEGPHLTHQGPIDRRLSLACLIGWRELLSRETLCGRLQRPLFFAECNAQTRSSRRHDLLADLLHYFT